MTAIVFVVLSMTPYGQVIIGHYADKVTCEVVAQQVGGQCQIRLEAKE